MTNVIEHDECMLTFCCQFNVCLDTSYYWRYQAQRCAYKVTFMMHCLLGSCEEHCTRARWLCWHWQRYKLFALQGSGHFFFVSALEMMKRVVNDMNNTIKSAENINKILSIQSSLTDNFVSVALYQFSILCGLCYSDSSWTFANVHERGPANIVNNSNPNQIKKFTGKFTSSNCSIHLFVYRIFVSVQWLVADFSKSNASTTLHSGRKVGTVSYIRWHFTRNARYNEMLMKSLVWLVFHKATVLQFWLHLVENLMLCNWNLRKKWCSGLTPSLITKTR
jgi:hypothetical protein